MIAPATTC